jgi:predicted dehydrogenase
MKTKVALVGLGKMGLMHASILKMMEDVDLVALCENNKLVTRFARKAIPNTTIFTDIMQLQDVKPEAVFITTPPASHFPIIKTLYQEGITRNIFTEKPLVVNYAQAKQICELAESYGGINMVGYQCRFSRTYQKAKELFETGNIGKALFFKGEAFSADFLGVKSATHTNKRGGVIDDLGCHIIDLSFWFLGDMKVINSKVISIIGANSQDEAYILMQTVDNIKGEINCSWCKEGYRLPDIKLLIEGEKGSISVNEDKLEIKSKDGKNLVYYKQDLDDFSPIFIGGTHYYRQDSLFISAVRNNAPVELTFKKASTIQKIIDDIVITSVNSDGR